MNKETENLRRLISENKIDQAIKTLLDLTKNDHDLSIQVISQSAKFKELRKKETLGILDNRDVELAQAKINYALLEIISEIEKTIKTVFISYNHSDAETANKLKEKLKAQNINVTIDNEQMQPGQDIREFIETSVRNTQVTLSIISRKSLLSDWVAMESVKTFNHEKTNLSKKFIGCCLDNDFLRDNFTGEALSTIEKEIIEIQTQIEDRQKENQKYRDLEGKLDRMKDLQNNMDEIIRRFHDSLCVDIRGENFESNFEKIVQAIKS